MFSKACVKNSVHGGVSQHALEQNAPRADTPPDRHHPPPGQIPPGQTSPKQMATAADGTHPTEIFVNQRFTHTAEVLN